MVNTLDRIGVHIISVHISEHISVHIKSEFTFIPNIKGSVILDHKARFNKFQRADKWMDVLKITVKLN